MKFKILFLLFCGFAFAEENSRVKLAKIRMIVDGREYEWTEAGMIPKNAESTAPVLKKETIISFLSIQPGQSSRVDTLENRCRDSQVRLIKSGYFYEASVMLVPQKIESAERTVVVVVTSGYLWRYAGGDAWGMLGKEGLGGERASFRLYAGWNKNGASYMHENAGGMPLAIGARLFYCGPGESNGMKNDKNGNNFTTALTVGRYIHPDVFLGMDASSEGFGPDSSGLISLQPYVAFQKFLKEGTDSDAGGSLRGYWYPEIETLNAEAKMFLHAGITEGSVFALSASGGLTGASTTTPVLFDLFYTDDRNVRSGYTEAELSARNFALASAEFRQTFVDFVVPPAINCRILGFVYTDVAGIAKEEENGNTLIADAYGAGLRILFANPIFASFTFSYGLSRDGEGRFIFAGTAGY